MRIYAVFLVALVTTFGCSDEPTPNEVVNNYSKNVRSALHVKDIDYSQYLSKRAQAKVIDGLKRVTPNLIDFDFSLSINDTPVEIKDKVIKVSSNVDEDRMFGFLLMLLKSEAEPCSTGNFKSVVNGSEATLTCAETNYLDRNGKVWQNYTRNFMLVNENGWRIDKISAELTYEGETSKSTTFE